MHEKTVTCKRAFDGRFLKIDVMDVELDSGLRTVREIVCHPGAAAVLPQLPDGRFVLVRQFRTAAERDVLEIMAGTLEPGENPDDCARRELEEETGYCAATLDRLGDIFPSPGYTTEHLVLYYATLHPEQHDRHGDEDENIEVVYASAEEIDTWIRERKIIDAKTLIAWLYYQERRDSLV